VLAFSSRFVAASLLDGLILRCPPFLSLLRFHPRDKRELDPVGSVLGRRVASFGGDGIGLEVNVSVCWLVMTSVLLAGFTMKRQTTTPLLSFSGTRFASQMSI
jgi:hypothetical protein